MSNPSDPPEVTIASAISATLEGEHEKAVWAMRWLMRVHPDWVSHFDNHPSGEVRLNFQHAKAEGSRAQEVQKLCSILGRGGTRLEPFQRKTIDRILAIAWDAWEKGERPRPRGATLFEGGDVLTPEAMKGIKLAVVMPRYVHGNPAYIESDHFYHLAKSAEAAGLSVTQFEADEISYDHTVDDHKPAPTRPLDESLAELTRFLDIVRPDVVAFEANFEPTANSIGNAYWNEQKRRLGFKLVAEIADSYDFANKQGYQFFQIHRWRDCVDQFLLFHELSLQRVGIENVVLAPCLPFWEGSFDPNAAKDIGICTIGSLTRGRELWLRPLVASGAPVLNIMHDRSRRMAPNREEYNSYLARARMTFNNGYLSEYVRLATGRFFEGVLSRALVFEEAGDPVDLFFEPYIHYVPVANVHQLIAFTWFFDEAEEWRKRIVDAAYDWMTTRYHSSKTWGRICGRLGLGARQQQAASAE